MELTAPINRDELVEKCKLGDSQSYHTIYQRYAKAMYNTSLRIVNNTADAEDVLQDAFVDAFRSLDDFHYRSTFGAWLKKIVVNKSITMLKKKKLTLIDIEQSEIVFISDDETVDEEQLDYKVQEVKKAILKLPDGYRTVISLYLLEGYDQEEISEILGISHNTVRTQYIRAKQRLLQIIKQGGHHES